VAPNRVTVEDATLAWLAAVDRAGRFKPPTLSAYRAALEGHVIPRIGRVKLPDLTTGMLEGQLVGAMVRDGLAPATIRRVMVPLSRALQRAVRNGQLRANPAREIDWSESLPKREARPVVVYSGRELHRLVECARDEVARTFIGLMAGTGLRVGEALALRRVDIDTDERTATVCGTVRGDRTIGEPKTKSSRRTVPVLPESAEHLGAADLLASIRSDDETVFCDLAGRPQRGHNVQHRWLPPACKAAGLPEGGWHAIRRSYADLPSKRTSPVNARDLLGHSDVRTTHASYQGQDSGEARVERLRRAAGW
jgi:integrase